MGWVKRSDDTVLDFLKRIGQDYPVCGFDIGEGWMRPVTEALEKASKVEGVTWKLAQVKQKFCQLRIYVDFEEDAAADGKRIWEEEHPKHALYKAVNACFDEAERQCNRMCEGCGNLHGLETPRSGIALCVECNQKRDW